MPFDIPEAETEIVAGAFTEYSGKRLALFRLAISIEMVVGASLLAAVFLPFGTEIGSTIGFLGGTKCYIAAALIVYLVKVFAVVAAIALARTVVARLRIDQMINFCWQYVAPAAFIQVLIDLIAKGLLRA